MKLSIDKKIEIICAHEIPDKYTDIVSEFLLSCGKFRGATDDELMSAFLSTEYW